MIKINQIKFDNLIKILVYYNFFMIIKLINTDSKTLLKINLNKF